MDLALAKPNRLKTKFKFNSRDWRYEMDGLVDERRVSQAISRDGTPPQVMWDRPLLAESQQLSLGAEEWLEG